MTYDEATDLLALLKGEYRNEAVDAARIGLWAKLFRDVPYGAAEDAALAWLSDPDRGRFCPRPAELLAMARNAEHPPAPANEAKPPHLIFRLWSSAADDWLELDAPVPYDEALHGWKANERRYAGEVLPGDPTPATHRARGSRRMLAIGGAR